MSYLFTIICEYKGGTYTKQLTAEHPVQAFEQWTEAFVQEGVLNTSEKKRFTKETLYSLKQSNLTPMENVRNVWYEGFSLGDDLLEIMVIAMSDRPLTFSPSHALTSVTAPLPPPSHLPA